MNGAASFPVLLEAFFTDRLMRQRQASPHTIASYRDTFRLLLQYAQQQLHKAPSDLALSELDTPLLGAFLDHLEQQRHNSARSRNVRLAALHSFFRYVALHEPQHSALAQRVLAMPSKRHVRQPIEFLTQDDVEALLAAPVMSGRSALNLANTFAAALVNVAACAALVPRLGIVGAAAGTALATAAVSLLGLVQARALLGLRLPARLVYKPLAAGLAALPLLLLPAALGDADTLALRLVFAAATVAEYLGALRLVGFEAEDRPLLNPFLERAPKAPAPPA